MEMTAQEIKDAMERIKESKAGTEKEIIGLVEEMAKAAKKGDHKEIAWVNKKIASRYEMLATMDRTLAELKEDLKRTEKAAGGWGPIVDFLERVYELDMEWYRELRADYQAKGYKVYIKMLQQNEITKTTLAFAKMSEGEVQSVFKQDLEIRYAKLRKQLEGKVGEIKEVKLDRNDNAGMDGTVEGTKGTVTLRTILAGGYNIQRWHYRTLIK